MCFCAVLKQTCNWGAPTSTIFYKSTRENMQTVRTYAYDAFEKLNSL